MSRLIDADALIDKYGDWYTEEGTEEGYIGTIKGIVDSMPTIEPQLDEWCDDCKEYDKERHCCPRWNHVIRTTLDDVRKEALAQRWVPCSERLPENGLYLITGKKGSVYPLKIEDGRWYGGIKPVAWMPLPEAFKEEQE